MEARIICLKDKKIEKNENIREVNDLLFLIINSKNTKLVNSYIELLKAFATNELLNEVICV